MTSDLIKLYMFVYKYRLAYEHDELVIDFPCKNVQFLKITLLFHTQYKSYL